MIFYFAFGFSTAVSTPAVEALGLQSSEVNNIGLLFDRLAGIGSGFGVLFIGVMVELACYIRRG